MEYTIIESTSTAALQGEVNAMSAKGWTPVGGVACLAEGPYGEPSFYQAMVKK